MTEERESFDPDAATQISAALVKTIAEAKAMADADNFGPGRMKSSATRASCDLLLEQVNAAGPDSIKALRAVCDAMGDNVRRLEELVGPRRPAGTGH